MQYESREEHLLSDEAGAGQRPMSRRDAIKTAGLAGVAAIWTTGISPAQAADEKPTAVQAKNPYGGVPSGLLPKLKEGKGYDLFRMMQYEASALGINIQLVFAGAFFVGAFLAGLAAAIAPVVLRPRTWVGLLVLSAWCLGVLNSHGRFFLSYAAPVVWNLAIRWRSPAG